MRKGTKEGWRVGLFFFSLQGEGVGYFDLGESGVVEKTFQLRLAGSERMKATVRRQGIRERGARVCVVGYRSVRGNQP